MNFTVAIHGGAGVIAKSDDGCKEYMDALQRIISQIFTFCRSNITIDAITAVDVVEFAVRLLEDEELFNAGKGAVFTADGTHELEASIMDGSNLKCGSASLINNVKNPISLARAVMDYTPHVYFAGDGATRLATRVGLELVDPTYFSTPRRLKHLLDAKAVQGVLNDHDVINNTIKIPTGTGTVGCVCVYKEHVAAATSTGGMTNKTCGRIGDTPITGAGNYANDKTAAVSSTGKGELFIQSVVAYDISARMEYGKQSLLEACEGTVYDKLPLESGGVIAVDIKGNCAMVFNSLGMFRASCDSTGKCEVGIWEETVSQILVDV